MKVRTHLAVMCLAVLVASSAAWADTTPIQTLRNPAAGTTTTDWSHNFLFDQFDPTDVTKAWYQGTLTGVHLSMDGDMAGTMRVWNSSAGPGDFTGSQKAIESLKLGATTLISITPTDATSWLQVPTLSWSSTYNSSDSLTGTWSSTSGLGAWIGSSTITLVGDALGSVTGSGPGTVIMQFSTEAAEEVKLYYDYEAIPEPGTMALVGLGLAGIGVWRKRRGKK